MGDADGDYTFYGRRPAVAFNSKENQYLVVWEGYEQLLVGPQPVEEYEVFGRIIAADGTIANAELRISNTGPDGDLAYRAQHPEVIYNPTANQFLVLWDGNNDTGNLVPGKHEIFAQLLDGSGAAIGAHLRISTTGVDYDVNLDSSNPAAAYNPDLNQYLVVWIRDHTSIGEEDDDDEDEIYGQLLAANGAEIGTDFRISDMGPDGIEQFDAASPAVSYNVTTGQYLVVWNGEDNNGDLVEGHQEIFGQFLEANGQETGVNDFRITYTGSDLHSDYDTIAPAVAYNPYANEFFVVSESDVDVYPGGEENEIVGRLLTAAGDDAAMGDIRLSNMGADETYDAYEPAVAYNAIDNEYLVVWSADDNLMQVVDEEYEILGQRIDAATGAEIGPNDFRISNMGPNEDPDYDASAPAVAHNPDLNQYLVVWAGDDDGILVDGEFEIHGQLLNADGNQTGIDDFRISRMGDNTDTRYHPEAPAVVYNLLEKQYLVVWHGNDITDDLTDFEHEIFGQLLSADGSETGDDDFRISDMGPSGDARFNAYNPALTHNVATNQYLVVWEGNDDPVSAAKFEIFGQLLNADGSEVGANDFRISDMEPDSDPNHRAAGSAVTYNPMTNQYLVVWHGADDVAGFKEHEIYGQLLNADGSEVGANDFRISDMGPDGDANYFAYGSTVTYDAIANQYLVVWYGADDVAGFKEHEIYGQALLADATETGENDFRLSDMGSDGDAAYGAHLPAVACGTIAGQCLVAWSADDDTIPLVDGEFEIFGQLYASETDAPPPPPPPPPSSTHHLFLPLMTR